MIANTDPVIGVPSTRPEDLALEDYVASIRWEYEIHAEPHEEDFRVFCAFTGPDELLVDIGASIGISVASFRKFARFPKIVSFEPCPWLSPPLAWLKEKEGDRFEYFMVAAGAESAVRELCIPCLNNVPNFYLASCAPLRFGPHPVVIRAMKELMGAKQTDVYSVCKVTVQIKPIDEFHLRPTLVKIDAETFEFDVLKGMTETIQLCRPLIMVEGANRNIDVLDFFQSRGYGFAERRESKLRITNETSESDNGFFVAQERIAEYTGRGLMVV